tara:strand:- start:3836 stop:4006 length:171 start_codon:yes stop_codon:yes gene_type:complete
MSKGSRQRTGNTPQFNDNYDKIFGAKNVRHDDQTPSKDEKAVNSECSTVKQKEGNV